MYQRLYRKSSAGYDLLYLETSSKMVIRPDGTTVEDALKNIQTPSLESLGAVSQEQMNTAIKAAIDKALSDIDKRLADETEPASYSIKEA